MRALYYRISCLFLAIVFCEFSGGCRPEPGPGDRLERRGDEISVAGQLIHTGTRVVLWNDPGGYDAYRPHRHFQPDKVTPTRSPKRIPRYGSFRKRLPKELDEKVRKRGWTLEDLQEVIGQVVVHFDACGTSRRCFEVLHDIRGLSCHFLLDLDGTVYQTLDLKERAWHAAQANELSVGIEIANVGAYADDDLLSKWYVEDEKGIRIAIPDEAKGGGLPDGFVSRPRKSEPARGTINGHELIQYDFTESQYLALEKLLVTLCRVFPKVEPRIPRDDEGRVSDKAFSSDEELYAFRGILGHWHVTERKVDPGPAFDWERVLKALRRAGIKEED